FSKFLTPARATFEVRKRADVYSGVPQHIEVVNFTKEILQVFQVSAPGGVFAWKEVFNGVAQALDPDAQFMKCSLRPRSKGTLMEVVGGRPFFECQVFEHDASGTHAGCAAWESPAPLPPLLAVKLLKCFQRFLLALDFSSAHVL